MGADSSELSAYRYDLFTGYRLVCPILKPKTYVGITVSLMLAYWK